MATKRVLRSTVDWVEMAQRCPTAQKANLQAFKSKSDAYVRKVVALPEEVPKIDWAYYKANAADKALVEQFEKQYSAVKIPYPDDQGVISKIDEEEKLFMSRVKVFIQHSNERIKKYEEEVERIRSTIPYDEMSEEEFTRAHPNFSIDALNRPTIWPHLPIFQHDKEDLSFFREKGRMAKGPDEYFPETGPYVPSKH